jgi:signal transduction histidine kinase
MPLSEGRWLQLAISDEQTQEVVGHLRAGLVAVWIGAVALGLLGGFFFTRRALRPVQRLANTARKVIESGDLALRVPERGTRDELDELSHLFNGVLARNQALVRGMREALDNVAHDLRTPLTRLRTGAEVALRDASDPQRIRDALADTIEDSERVLQMLNTLMDISQAETGVMKLDRTKVDLSELAREAIDLYQHVAEERGVRLLTHLAAGVNVNGDHNRLNQVVANLVDNAIKYTPAGGQVELATAREDLWASLTVKDSGVGISAQDLPRIWERLYRADQSRSERGLGLGLSFVKAIVEAHGGRAEVRSELGAGSTFVVRLPVV